MRLSKINQFKLWVLAAMPEDLEKELFEIMQSYIDSGRLTSEQIQALTQ